MTPAMTTSTSTWTTADVDENDEDVTTVYGDNAYGTGRSRNVSRAGIDLCRKTQQPNAAGGLFTKDRFVVDLDEGTVTCPAGLTVETRRHSDGGMAYFGDACANCPLQAKCTTASGGRTIGISPY